MSKKIRMGICLCTELYHGEFDGMLFEIPGLAEMYELQEVQIPEVGQSAALKEARCPFFLDVHTLCYLQPVRYNIFLTLCEFVPNGGRGEKLYEGTEPGTSKYRRVMRWKELTDPPTKQEISVAMGELMRMVPGGRRALLLKRATPIEELPKRLEPMPLISIGTPGMA